MNKPTSQIIKEIKKKLMFLPAQPYVPYRQERIARKLIKQSKGK